MAAALCRRRRADHEGARRSATTSCARSGRRGRRRSRRTAPRTSSWPCCRTSCARRSTPSTAGRACCRAAQLRDEALVARAMDAIVRNADAQVQLIDDLLDVSRITSGKMRLDVRPRRAGGGGRGGARRRAARPPTPRPSAWRPSSTRAPVPVDGRPRPAAAGRLEPADERGQVHARRGAGSTSSCAARGLARRDRGQRHRPGDRAGRCCPTCSSGSGRPTARARARTAASGSAWPSSGTWSSCTAATVVAQSAGEGRGATFTVALPRRSGRLRPGGAGAPAQRAAPSRPAPASVRLDGVRVLVADDDRDAARAGRGDPRPGRAPRSAPARRRRGLDGAPPLAPRRARVRHRDAGRGRLLADPQACAPSAAGGGRRHPAVALTRVRARRRTARARSPPASACTCRSRSTRGS